MIETISSLLWSITTIAIVLVGIYYSIKLKFPQFRWIKIFKSLSGNKKNNSLQLLNMTLAGKIGVGSISGIALCIYIGGVSSIFWLWISTLILASLSYVETKLGIKYRKKIDNEYVGGPSFYIEKELGKKRLATLYSILIIITYIFAFISIQTNTIVISFENTFDINKVTILFFLIIITYLSIRKGVKTISKITNVLVPIMGGIYIIIGLIIIINNGNKVIPIILSIIKNAFSFDGLKTSILVPIIIGVERGIFSTEAGLGTTAMISSMANDTNEHSQANVQIIGTLFTSLIICTITALIILTSNYQDLNFTNFNGIELVSYSLYEHFGYTGIVLLTIIIFLFSFSTIVTCYYYGESNIKYLLNKNSKILKFVVIIIITYSAYANPNILWKLVDIVTALITLINVYSMFKLRKKI